VAVVGVPVTVSPVGAGPLDRTVGCELAGCRSVTIDAVSGCELDVAATTAGFTAVVVVSSLGSASVAGTDVGVVNVMAPGVTEYGCEKSK
jgi:hypothetical protein